MDKKKERTKLIVDLDTRVIKKLKHEAIEKGVSLREIVERKLR